MKEKLSLALAPRFASVFMRLLHACTRVRHLNPSNLTSIAGNGGRYLIAFWHCHILLMVFSRHHKPISVMISQHRDGEYIASTMKRFGVEAARGSSSRGGRTALIQLIDRSASGWNIAITPDGPRGPARVAQMGVVYASRKAGVPIVPVAVVSSRKARLRSWDRFEVPWPFSRVMFVYGDPIRVPADTPEEGLERWRLAVENAMNELCEDADARFDELWTRAEPGIGGDP